PGCLPRHRVSGRGSSAHAQAAGEKAQNCHGTAPGQADRPATEREEVAARGVSIMPSVFKKSIIRYLDANVRQVPKGTADARKVKAKSSKWYGRVPGSAAPVPLCTNKGAAQIMLNELVKKAELAKVGVSDPFEAHHKRPLVEHLADFEAALRAKGSTLKQAK